MFRSCCGIGVYTAVYTFKDLAEALFVGNDIADLLELLLIGRAVDPQMDISSDTVFLLHVLIEPLPLLLLVQFWIMFEPELDSTREDDFWIEIPVSLRHNLAVDGSWHAGGGGAMILHSLLHDLYLLG